MGLTIIGAYKRPRITENSRALRAILNRVLLQVLTLQLLIHLLNSGSSAMIDEQDMQQHIVSQLRELEQQHQITILYAVESGSRAWGFASTDSDWDVRFIYLRPYEWYLSIDNQSDTIEAMLPNDLDLSGWDLRKTLGLFRK